MVDRNLLKSYKVQCGQEIIDELLFCFDSEVPKKVSNAFDCLESGNAENLKGTLHALKNSFMNVGATIEGNYCQALEDQVHTLSHQDIQMGLRQIESSVSDIQKELVLALSLLENINEEDELK